MKVNINSVAVLFVITMGCYNTRAAKFPSDNLIFTPTSDNTYFTDDKNTIQYEISGSTRRYIAQRTSSVFYLGIRYSEEEKTQTKVVAFDSRKLWVGDQKLIYETYNKLEISNLNARTDNESEVDGFLIYLNGIGYAMLDMDIVEVLDYNETSVILTTVYKLSVVRKQRLVDMAFNNSIAILAIFNTFALGCLSDIKVIKHESRKLAKMAIAFLTQYLILPLVSDKGYKMSDIHRSYPS